MGNDGGSGSSFLQEGGVFPFFLSLFLSFFLLYGTLPVLEGVRVDY